MVRRFQRSPADLRDSIARLFIITICTNSTLAEFRGVPRAARNEVIDLRRIRHPDPMTPADDTRRTRECTRSTQSHRRELARDDITY